MIAQRRPVNFRCQFHNPLATHQHQHEASKPSRRIADFCSVTTRLHQESRKVSREICARVEALLVPKMATSAPWQSKSPNQMPLYRKAQHPQNSIAPCQNPEIYIPNLAALLAFAHLLLPANDIALLPASLMYLFLLGFSPSIAGASCAGVSPLLTAHLAFIASDLAFLRAREMLHLAFRYGRSLKRVFLFLCGVSLRVPGSSAASGAEGTSGA